MISAKIFVYILTGDKFNMSVKSSKEENYFMRTKSRILYLLLSICLIVGQMTGVVLADDTANLYVSS